MSRLCHLLPVLVVTLLTACNSGPTVRVRIPTPIGPLIIEFIPRTPGARPVPVTNTEQTTTIDGKVYQVYIDSAGNRYVRDPNPPNEIVLESEVLGTNPQDAAPPPGTGVLNPRGTSRPALWDFRGETYAGLCARTGIDRLNGQTNTRQSFTGANVLMFDLKTLETHVVYSMRQDIGFPNLRAHPNVRYAIQLLPGPSPSEGFLSIAVEGDARDIARFLLAQGIVRLDGIPVEHADQVYSISAAIDGTARTLTLSFGAHALAVIPIDR